MTHTPSPVPKFPRHSELQAIQNRGKVRIAVERGSILARSGSGKRFGFEIDMAKVAARGLFGGTAETAARYIEFVDISAAERDRVCNEDRADIVAAQFAITRERTKRVDFTDPYYGDHFAVLTRTDQRDVDVRKSSITVIEGTTCEAFVRNHDIGAKIIYAESGDELAHFVKNGTAAAAIDSILGFRIRAEEDPELTVAAWSLQFELWAMAVRKGNEDLRQLINRQLSGVMPDSMTEALTAGTAWN